MKKNPTSIKMSGKQCVPDGGKSGAFQKGSGEREVDAAKKGIC
jgi:hypothetical protein